MRKVTKCPQVNKLSSSDGATPHPLTESGRGRLSQARLATLGFFGGGSLQTNRSNAVLLCPTQPAGDLMQSLPVSQCAAHTRAHLGLSVDLGDRSQETGRQMSPQPQAQHRSSVILCKFPSPPATQCLAAHAPRCLEKIICDLFLAPAP